MFVWLLQRHGETFKLLLFSLLCHLNVRTQFLIVFAEDWMTEKYSQPASTFPQYPPTLQQHRFKLYHDLQFIQLRFLCFCHGSKCAYHVYNDSNHYMSGYSWIYDVVLISVFSCVTLRHFRNMRFNVSSFFSGETSFILFVAFVNFSFFNFL